MFFSTFNLFIFFAKNLILYRPNWANFLVVSCNYLCCQGEILEVTCNKEKNVTTWCQKRKPSLKYVNISQICFMKKVSQTVVLSSLTFLEKKIFFSQIIYIC